MKSRRGMTEEAWMRRGRHGGALARCLRALAVLWMAVALSACTPEMMLLSSLIPDGTTSVLLSHLEGEADANRKRILELESRKDWDGISKFAEENLAKDKNNPSWWFVAGYAHAEAGRRQRAIDCYNEMVRLSPDDPAGWVVLAQAYRDAKQPLRAIQTLNNAHVVRNGTATTYYLLGESYSDLDRDLPASAAYREATRLDTEFSQAWFGLGRTSARLGRAADFEAALKSLQKLNPALAKELAELRPGAVK
jgi:predicted Zn-dependent protease